MLSEEGVGHMPVPPYTIHFQPSSNGTVLVGRVTIPRPFWSEFVYVGSYDPVLSTY